MPKTQSGSITLLVNPIVSLIVTISHLFQIVFGRRRTLLALSCLSARTTPVQSFAALHYQTMTIVRRSPRLRQLYSTAIADDDLPPKKIVPKVKPEAKKKASAAQKTSSKSAPKPKVTKPKEIKPKVTKPKVVKPKAAPETLPRTRELELLQDQSGISFIMGIDEAGRGPLAGPVVAAAILSTCATVEGICDSKKLTKEPMRDALYQKLVSSPNIRYAVAVVDAKTIDDINILQATYVAMRMAASGVLGLDTVRHESNISTTHEGCYVVVGATDADGQTISDQAPLDSTQVFSLIDGNGLPPKFPTEAETMVKGDGREYLIGAASILAKVSRDTLMHEYHEQYPHFMLGQHKGYGTAKHMDLVAQYGPLPIHRMTFAPLKHMDLGDEKKEGEESQKKDVKKTKRKKSS